MRIVYAILIIILFICIFAGISYIKKIQAEIREHLNNAAQHTKEGIFNTYPTIVMFVDFYKIISQAEETIENASENTDYDEKIALFETAISQYEAASIVAQTLSYNGGVSLTKTRIEKMHERIIAQKRAEGIRFYSQGDILYNSAAGFYFGINFENFCINDERLEMLEPTLDYYKRALYIFLDINDTQYILSTMEKIDVIEQVIIKRDSWIPPEEETETEETKEETDNDTIALSNYEHNLRLNFNLRTPIDNQNQFPASEVRMGTRDGYNEGWYNGCGWIATYNALIILGNPIHPAEIVKHFEDNIGTVLGGVFGTYPNAVFNYLDSLGYNVNQATLFNLKIDESIKSSKVSIIAYAHTTAAHYVAIEYNEDIDKFIIYNDSFARAYSKSLNFQDYTTFGAAVDSVEAFIRNTPNIMFAFSLITIT